VAPAVLRGAFPTDFENRFVLWTVGIIHYNGEHVADKTDAMELGRFIITFVMSWQVWSDVQQGISWFEANDVVQRVYILFIIACLLGYVYKNPCSQHVLCLANS